MDPLDGFRIPMRHPQCGTSRSACWTPTARGGPAESQPAGPLRPGGTNPFLRKRSLDGEYPALWVSEVQRSQPTSSHAPSAETT